MRKWFYILLLLVPMLSCVGQKDDPAQEVRLVADLTALNVTAGEQASRRPSLSFPEPRT